MPDFYNRTRGPLCITLGNGRSVTVKPKAWVSLSAEDMGSARLTEHIQSGNLLPSPLPPDPEPVQAVAPLPVVVVMPVPVAVVRDVEAPKVDLIPDPPPQTEAPEIGIQAEVIPALPTFKKPRK